MELLTPLSRFLHYADTMGEEVFLRQSINGGWKEWTWKSACDEILKIANFLQTLSLPAQSNIAILSKNCAHWIMADLAIQAAGHVSVPLYAGQAPSAVKEILIHAQARAAFIGKLDEFELQKQGIPSNVRQIGISIYGISTDDLWEQIVASGHKLKEPRAHHAVDLCTIMYTSGTTGTPKGVMLTYGAIDFAVANAIADLGLSMHPRLFSYLPLSHIAERIGIEMIGLYLGGTFSFAETIESFSKNLAETQPTIFFAVPRIWTKFREKILEQIPERRLNTLLRVPLLSSIIKKRIHKKMGLRFATHIFTGAAPVSIALLQWFDRIGIEIFQAYAMTENCCYGHFNMAGANKIGTVGRPLSEIEVKLSGDGEVLIRHKALMKGYFREQALTEQAFEDGFLKTGDIGTIDSANYLTLIGRLKEQFKTDKGKLIAPTPLETLLLNCASFDQVCVVGSGLPQPIALVTLSDIAHSQNRKEVARKALHAIEEINATLGSAEKIAKVIVLHDTWTMENGLLTPTMKVKRHELERRFASRYDWWFGQPDPVVWE